MKLQNFIELTQYYPYMLKGVWWTLYISAWSIAVGSVLGMLAALMRVSSYRVLNWIAAFYVDLFRTTPLLVQLIWFFYAFPIVIGMRLSEMQAGLLAMVLFTGAYLSETFRGGIVSVEKGQTDAGLALGMTRLKLMWRIVIPQAVIRMIPEIANHFVSRIKDSSLVSVIGVPEILRQASQMGEFSAMKMEALTIAAILYFCITFPLTQLTDWLHKRFSSTDTKRPMVFRRKRAAVSLQA
jgi:polar amino acid transport system permease protein